MLVRHAGVVVAQMGRPEQAGKPWMTGLFSFVHVDEIGQATVLPAHCFRPLRLTDDWTGLADRAAGLIRFRA